LVLLRHGKDCSTWPERVCLPQRVKTRRPRAVFYGAKEPTRVRSMNMPLVISLENVGDGFRVNLAERDHGWERIIRSAWYPHLPSARARAREWSVENGHCPVWEIGTAPKPA
jgi:hypothetical protein